MDSAGFLPLAVIPFEEGTSSFIMQIRPLYGDGL
jgi:hypothetical protein